MVNRRPAPIEIEPGHRVFLWPAPDKADGVDVDVLAKVLEQGKRTLKADVNQGLLELPQIGQAFPGMPNTKRALAMRLVYWVRYHYQHRCPCCAQTLVGESITWPQLRAALADPGRRGIIAPHFAPADIEIVDGCFLKARGWDIGIYGSDPQDPLSRERLGEVSNRFMFMGNRAMEVGYAVCTRCEQALVKRSRELYPIYLMNMEIAQKRRQLRRAKGKRGPLRRLRKRETSAPKSRSYKT